MKRWPVMLWASFLAAGVAEPLAVHVGAGLLGFANQSAKICVDTIVQEEIPDDFRGRVFSFYDTLFNLTFVVAAVIGAFALPMNGRSYPVVISPGAGYAALAAGYAAAERPRIAGLRATAPAQART